MSTPQHEHSEAANEQATATETTNRPAQDQTLLANVARAVGPRALQRKLAQRLQRRSASAAAGGQAAGGEGESHLLGVADAGTRGAGGSLPHHDAIQSSFGKHDVSSVKSFVGGPAAQAADVMGASAFASGNAVGFHSAPSLHTAAHEAAHVVQQRSGVHLKGGVGEAGDPHEQHADQVADAVVAGHSAEPLLDRYSGGGAVAHAGAGSLQRTGEKDGKPSPSTPGTPTPGSTPGHDGPAHGAHGAPPVVTPPAHSTPTTMAQLILLDDTAMLALAADTAADGKLMALLKTVFEANWFKAKDCLVFNKWPGGVTPHFSGATSLAVMKQLTILRGAVHDLVKPRVQEKISAEVAKHALKSRESNPAMAKGLTADAANKTGSAHVNYIGAVGADSVTSDTDVSTGGINSEIGVRLYNEEFRAFLGLAVDCGTVFDLNVYAKDFINGKPKVEDHTISAIPEHDVKISKADAEQRDEKQEIASLIHIARYMDNRADWDAYTKSTLDKIADPAKKKDQMRLSIKAWEQCETFKRTVALKMEEMKASVDESLATLGASAWKGGTNDHYGEEAVRMRACNAIYQEKLLGVKELRLQINELKTSGADADKLQHLVALLTGRISDAMLYANEVYGSGGATVHAVYGMQTKKKEQEAEDKKAKTEGREAAVIKVDMPVEQWFETFNDNLGDVLKDYQHFGSAHGHGAAPPDYWYAAFKMGKYADRMIDAVPHLHEGGLLTQPQFAETSTSAPYVDLSELAVKHVTEKGGAAKDDPKTLKTHAYFGRFDKGGVDKLKSEALTLGSDVRAKVATTRPLREAKKSTAPSIAPTGAPPSASSSPPPTPSAEHGAGPTPPPPTGSPIVALKHAHDVSIKASADIGKSKDGLKDS